MKLNPFIRVTVLCYLLFSTFLYSENESDTEKKTSVTLDTTASASRIIDVNNMGMWVQNNGLFGTSPKNYTVGLFYPRLNDVPINRNRYLIYMAGLMLGAKINDTLRTMNSYYWVDGSPGYIDDNGNAIGRHDPAFHVYKIGKADSLLNNRDYQEWPVDQGAPTDEFGKPLHIGDQTLWCCFNDMYPIRYRYSERISKPLGAEIHMTVFGWYKVDNMIFLQWTIMNKSKKNWHDTYVGLPCDCELGDPGDDLVGSDSTLTMVYDYNSRNDDWYYGVNPPAFGYVFLQTPIITSPGDSTFIGNGWIKDYTNLPAKAPIVYKSGQYNWNEHFNVPNSAYTRMQGLNDDGEPMIDPITGQKTDWGFSGNPITGTGWIDPKPHDRRFMLSSGPFDMAPGDSQTMTMAIVVGHGASNLESINILKLNAKNTWSFYFQGYKGPWDLPIPSTEQSNYDQRCIITWDHHKLCYSPAVWEGFNTVDYQFEGYNIYQGESPEGPWHPLATYDLKNGITVIWDLAHSETLGCVTEIPVAHGSDTGVQHFTSITQDYNGKPLINSKTYYFAVSAYFYDPNGLQKVWETEKTVIQAVPQRALLETQFSYSFGDTIFSEDGLCHVLAIDPARITGDTYQVDVEEIDGELVWHLTDISTDEVKLQSWDYFGTDNSFPIVDGFMVQVTKDVQDGDSFTFTTNAPQKSAEIAKSRLDEINVFPNPYFGQNSTESDFYTQFVTFNNLPEECTVRIFSLSGVLVKTIPHDNGTPFERWYLMNESRMPVASGMYIIHVQTDFGDRIFKFAFINREARYLHL